MQITVVDVAPPATKTSTNGRQYQEIELTFKDDQGKTGSRKILSFTTDIYKAVQGLQRGASVNVNRQKNDKTGYWDWISFGEAPAGQVTSAPATGGSTKVVGSNYETKEERAARQVMIVRQSSLSTAVAALTVGAKGSLKASDIIPLAKELEGYVLGTIQTRETPFDDLLDDLPT